MSKYKVGMISLGCDKNRVDSEIMLGVINKEYEITNNAKEADIIIVNTCGFIETAKQESIDTILEMAEYKTKYNCKLLIATGCLTQRYGKELKELMPEIDIMLGVNDYKVIDKIIYDFIREEKVALEVNYSDSNINEGERILTTKSHTAYIRIAEGCNNFCTYCIIPKIRGKFRSRKMENIIDEASKLSKMGVKELILIAQDTTLYGSDIYGEKTLHKLISELSKIEGIEWIRILYCYPEEIYGELIEEMASNKKVLKYLDLPIQHISNNVLKLMGRRTTKEKIIDKINELRKWMPEITLRTSLIVGFPGESENDFNELKEFLNDYKLEKVGVFKYSREEGTPASIMDNQIEEEVKEVREKELMEVQQQVSKDNNANKIGKVYECIVEGFNGDSYYGRSYEMAPEIDGMIIFKSLMKIEVGSIVKVKIVESADYDLMGVVVYELSK
ncbi:MAG: 30S ribosomal protein S12 methylthiotransferase RimO [Clostridium sp.]